MELLIIGVIGLSVYFMPTIIANHRRNRQVAAIFVLNLLLGWTLLGWVGALVWALINTESRYAIPGYYAEVPYDEYHESDNPYHPLSPEGQAWFRGLAARGRQSER